MQPSPFIGTAFFIYFLFRPNPILKLRNHSFKTLDNCIFCKIANKEIPKEFTYEDEEVMVFPDTNPVKPVHLLVIPKKHIPELAAVDDPKMFQKLFVVAQKMIIDQKLEDKGYRIVINGGGAQVIDHLHVHVMGPITKTASLG